MKKLDSIWRWVVMGGLISLMFVNLSCSDATTYPEDDCGCVKEYGETVWTYDPLPSFKTVIVSSEAMPCDTKESFISLGDGNFIQTRCK